jgi:hypothetical protein
MSNKEASEKEAKHFWETATGIILSLIALLTAIITCIGAIIGSPQILSFIIPASSSTPIIITSTPLPPVVITSTPSIPENTPLPSLMPTAIVIVVTQISPLAPVQTPKMYGFTLCSDNCNGTNAIPTRQLPERTGIAHAQWQYENIPVGSDYIRTWSKDGREWVRYHCSWPGPETGTYTVSLTEPMGMESGVWEMTIIVNGAILMREQIEVLGNYVYWSDAGSHEKCR